MSIGRATTPSSAPTRRRRVPLIAGTVALLLVAAGCGGETTTEAASSPLAEFLGQGDFLSDRESAEAQFAEEERARQEIIAACMQRQGFEYTPVDYSQFDTFSDGIDEWGSPEWIAEWGFGITTQRFSQAQVGPNLKGWDDSQFEEEADGFVDPNDDYIQSLGPAEQEAYFEALYGGDDAFPTIDESMSEEEQEAIFEDMTFEPQGCEGEAFNEDNTFAFYMDFADELEEMDKRFEADPRVAERRQEITSCVTDKGHDYTDMESLYERFEADLQEIDPYAGGDFEEPDFGISEDEMAQMSEAELDEFFENFEFTEPELSEEDKVKLGELQTEEIELAVAVDGCGGGWEQEFELLSGIRAEYEQEFIDTYGDQLAEYRAG